MSSKLLSPLPSATPSSFIAAPSPFFQPPLALKAKLICFCFLSSALPRLCGPLLCKLPNIFLSSPVVLSAYCPVCLTSASPAHFHLGYQCFLAVEFLPEVFVLP